MRIFLSRRKILLSVFFTSVIVRGVFFLCWLTSPFRYFHRIQEQITDFVTTNSAISKEAFEGYMMATGEMATDVGTILYGEDAVASGLIDSLGDLNDALTELHTMIENRKHENNK